MERNRLPEGFGEMLCETLGEAEGRALADALETPGGPVSVRLNPRKPVDTPIYEGMRPVVWNPCGRYLTERPSFTLNPLLHAGAFYVQEAASMIHGYIASHLPFSEKVLAVDLCAAPGGKTGAVLDMLPEGSLMVANEFVGQRANILRENLAKLGTANVIVTNSSVDAIGRLGSTFDLMVADVPCSGEGMMRKEEVARSQWSTELIESCQKLQREILRDALPALRPGGYLIYSTCTFNRAEDEENLRWLTEEMGLENIPIEVPAEWEIQPSVDPEIHALRFLPNRTEGEGLFVALLRKPEDAEPAPSSISFGTTRKGKIKGKNYKENNKATAPDLNGLRTWTKPGFGKLIASETGTVNIVSPEAEELTNRLRAAGARILSTGVEVATLKGRDFVPSAYLALSEALNPTAFPTVDLSRGTALDYLRHEAVRLPDSTPKGFVLLTYSGLPLGFAKNIGNRANNLYPSEWRIRNL